jgi:sulfite exporter TauE/SafE
VADRPSTPDLGRPALNTAYLIAPLVGLLSGLHCIGMCGGIVGALTFSLPARVRRETALLLAYTLAYNLGRVLSYMLAGALFGWLGGLLFAAGGGWAAWLLRTLAALVTIAIGLYVAGWCPRFAQVERLGEPLWRQLEPLGRRLLPVRSLSRAVFYGAIWGWLPCGLVYAMLIAAPAQSSSVGGAVYMGLFGLGTLPVMLGTGLLAGRLRELSGRPGPRVVGGLGVVGLGLFTLLSQQI